MIDKDILAVGVDIKLLRSKDGNRTYQKSYL